MRGRELDFWFVGPFVWHEHESLMRGGHFVRHPVQLAFEPARENVFGRRHTRRVWMNKNSKARVPR